MSEMDISDSSYMYRLCENLAIEYLLQILSLLENPNMYDLFEKAYHCHMKIRKNSEITS